MNINEVAWLLSSSPTFLRRIEQGVTQNATVEVVKAIGATFVTCSKCKVVLKREDAKFYVHVDHIEAEGHPKVEHSSITYYYCPEHAPAFDTLVSKNDGDKHFLKKVNGMVEVSESGKPVRPNWHKQAIK